ncbi:MAG: type II toxin-antitoxin system YafQ family toxin [Draconibacterium sp.]|nr:type II toxin-antitoxin system YafQ family toxin [Draconibacterium sp.]
MYILNVTGNFKKDLKTLKKRSITDFEVLKTFIINLSENGFDGIAKKHKPHKLKGKFVRHNECHVLPDLLLIWMENKTEKQITLVRAGTHSDLF